MGSSGFLLPACLLPPASCLLGFSVRTLASASAQLEILLWEDISRIRDLLCRANAECIQKVKVCYSICAAIRLTMYPVYRVVRNKFELCVELKDVNSTSEAMLSSLDITCDPIANSLYN